MKYEISDTGEEVEVCKVECLKCHHYELLVPAKAQKVFDDWENYKCDLCYIPKGMHKVVRQYIQCGVCQQVMDPKHNYCYCPDKPKKLLTYLGAKSDLKSPNNPNAVEQRIKDQIEEDKFKRLQITTVQNSKRAAYEREIRMDKNLQILADAATKKEPVKVTKINHGAIL